MHQVCKTTSQTLAYTNMVFTCKDAGYVIVNGSYVFKAQIDPLLPEGYLGTNSLQRRYAGLIEGTRCEVVPFMPFSSELDTLVFELKPLQKHSGKVDFAALSADILKTYQGFPFSEGQIYAIDHLGTKFTLTVSSITLEDFVLSPSQSSHVEPIKKFGILKPQTEIRIVGLVETHQRYGIIRLKEERWEEMFKTLDHIKSLKVEKISVVLVGPRGSGKSSLSIYLSSGFPFVKLITADNMLEMSENQKINHMKKMFDEAMKIRLSVIILDDIERIVELSNLLLQALLVLIQRKPPVGNRLMIIGTTAIEYMELLNAFDIEVNIPLVSYQSLQVIAKELGLDSENFEDLKSYLFPIGVLIPILKADGARALKLIKPKEKDAGSTLQSINSPTFH